MKLLSEDQALSRLARSELPEMKMNFAEAQRYL